MKKWLATSFFCLGACGLGNTETDRQEVLDRLRAIGVEVLPLVTQIPEAGESAAPVTLNVYAAIPGDDTVTVEPWVNPTRKGATYVLGTSDVVVDSAHVEEQKIGNLRILKIPVATSVPAITQKLVGPEGGATFQYGFRLSTGARTEYLSGEFLAYKKGSPELDWKAPTLAVTYPAENQQVARDSEDEIAMTAQPAQDELVLPGWFVASGVIQNRRRVTSTWTPKTSGELALIATARGRYSFGFSIQILKVQVP